MVSWSLPTRGGGALVASVLAHAALAVTAGVVIRASARPTAPEIVELDVEVGAGNAPDDAPSSAAANPAHPNPSHPEPARAEPALHRRARATLTGLAPVFATTLAPAPPEEAALPARFSLRAVTRETRGPAVVQSSDIVSSIVFSPGSSSDAPAPFAESDVSVPARLLTSPPVVYPRAAREAQLEVDLPVEIVVGADGRVASARGLRRAGYGLDEAALQALRSYLFAPASRDGRPVSVRMRWTVQFRLQ